MSATLKNIQQTLQAYLLDRNEPNDLVVGTENVPASVRLGIYANAYRARLVEALAADYQMLKVYLGDDEFAALVHAYIEVHPSRYFSMRPVGGKLAEFIHATAPYSEHVDVYELARFEWALCHAFDAPDAKPLATDMLAALAAEQWPALTLRFAPSLQAIELKSNAPQIWRALSADETPPALAQASESAWLIWRKQLRLMFRPADALEMMVLEVFRTGATFADVCALLAEQLAEEAVPVRAVGILRQWLQDELIIE